MLPETEPDPARLQAARDEVRSFLKKKRRSSHLLIILACIAELTFFALMLVFMDFHDRLHWFLMFGFLLVYLPLLIVTWHNSVKIDQLYYRLIEELKYRE